MIHVPELKPGDPPFDPDFLQAMTPWKKEGRGRRGIPSALALPLEHSPWTEEPRETHPLTPEERIHILLNLAVVKEAVTQFHRDEDAHLRRLETATSTAICDLVTEHDAFLRDAVAAGEAACGTEERKALFRTMTATCITQSRERARRLQAMLAERYWRQSVEAQNAELLARAQREENIANDKALALYRDLILYNIENMLTALPEEEQRRAMDAAAAAFYRKTLEKRLERDPGGARAMAGEREVRRVLGEAACAALEKRAENAVREQELERLADAWVEEKRSPAEAKEQAAARFGKEEERALVLRRYDAGRFEENKTRVSAMVANCATVWEGLKAKEFDENAIPAWVARNNPALAACLRDCVQARADAGGGAGRVAYSRLVKFWQTVGNKGVRGAIESLREEEKGYALLTAAGGPEGEEWIRCVRFLGGVAGEEDREWIAALCLAWGESGRSETFMQRFSDALKRRKERGSLDAVECIRQIEENFPE